MLAPRKQSRIYRVLALLLTVGMAAGILSWSVLAKVDRESAIETITLKGPVDSAGSIMCPWRNPKRDISQFFPGATRIKTRLLVFSSFRNEVIERVGQGDSLGTNQVYTHTLYKGNQKVGVILPRQIAGEYGSAEFVLALDTHCRVVGFEIQRLREPNMVASALQNPRWCASFKGRTSSSDWKIGQDIGNVPAVARSSARRFVSAARALTIEYQVARTHGEG